MTARRKYQVFISSTYTDMKDERQAAVEAILTAGHIPAGMELFAAGDESQLEAIKRWILESDIYLLILGSRYGSIEPKSGLSYSEVEYDHAVVSGKPHFALVLTEEAVRKKEIALAVGAAVLGPAPQDNPEKLAAFRAKVLNKVSRFVDDTKDVKIHIPEAIRGLEDRHTITGWIRGDESVDATPLMSEISRLTARTQELESELHAARASLPVTPPGPPLADLDDQVELTVAYNRQGNRYEKAFKIAWGRLFALISPKLAEHPADSTMRGFMGREVIALNGYDGVSRSTALLTEQSHYTVRTQFEALGLISVSYLRTVSNTMGLFWNITDRGAELMREMRVVRK